MYNRIKTGGIQVDHFHHIINVRPTWAKKAKNINSYEATKLKEIAEAFPNYNITIKGINIQKKKESYKGLTYTTMEDYIRSHDLDGSIKREYLEIREKAVGHSIRYANVKHWFLSKFPDYDSFEPICHLPVNDKENSAA